MHDFEKLNHITDSEVLKDINDTEVEINNIEYDIRIQKLKIENGERGILERREFINKLKKLLDFRNKQIEVSEDF